MTLCGREIRPASICISELFLTTFTAPVSVSTRTIAAGSAGLAAVMSTSLPEAEMPPIDVYGNSIRGLAGLRR